MLLRQVSRQIFQRTHNRLFVQLSRGVSAQLARSYDPDSKEKREKLLFTPGPLSTSFTVRKAAMRDLGSRDSEFQNALREIRKGLLTVAAVSADDFTAVPIQGSGTFGVEAVLSSVADKKKGFLLIANGAYGMRMVDMCKAHSIAHTLLQFREDQSLDLAAIDEALRKHPEHSHVAVVHSETTSGIINNVQEIGELVHRHGRSFVVDAMSSFGCVPVDFATAHVDFLISSANKCLEGIPGFSFVIARKSALQQAKGRASSLSLDLYAQWAELERSGQFRFTPPTHALLAFRRALTEHAEEGGVLARAKRYKENQRVVREAMARLGFRTLLSPEQQGYIITSYRYPEKNWDFDVFYRKLNERGFVIYPGKVTNANCFRIGHIGRIFPDESRELVKAVEDVCREMKTAAFAN